eukprot:1036030-Amphidinium_carterae.1
MCIRDREATTLVHTFAFRGLFFYNRAQTAIYRSGSCASTSPATPPCPGLGQSDAELALQQQQQNAQPSRPRRLALHVGCSAPAFQTAPH